MNVTFEAFGKTRQGTITTGRYADNGRLAVSVLLDTGEPWATLSVMFLCLEQKFTGWSLTSLSQKHTQKTKDCVSNSKKKDLLEKQNTL